MPSLKIELLVDDKGTVTVQNAINNFGKLDQVARQSGSALEKMSSSIQGHWATIAAAGAAVALGWSEAKGYIEEAAKAEQSAEAFKNVVDAYQINGGKMVEELKKVTNETIDDSDLMQKAMKALSGGMSVENIIKSAEIARMSARRMGEDVGTSFSNITDAIETGAVKQLRSYHLITPEQKKLIEAAKEGGMQVDLMRIVMANYTVQAAAMGGMTENTAEKLQKLKAHSQETGETIGGALIWGLQKAYGIMIMAAAAAMELAKGLVVLEKSRQMGLTLSPWKDTREQAKKEVAAMNEMFDNMTGAQEEIFKKFDSVWGNTSENTSKPSNDAVKKAKKEVEDLMAEMKKAGDKGLYNELIGAQLEWKKAIDALEPSLQKETKELQRWEDQADILRNKWKEKKGIGLDTSWITEGLKRAQELIRQSGMREYYTEMFQRERQLIEETIALENQRSRSSLEYGKAMLESDSKLFEKEKELAELTGSRNAIDALNTQYGMKMAILEVQDRMLNAQLQEDDLYKGGWITEKVEPLLQQLRLLGLQREELKNILDLDIKITQIHNDRNRIDLTIRALTDVKGAEAALHDWRLQALAIEELEMQKAGVNAVNITLWRTEQERKLWVEMARSGGSAIDGIGAAWSDMYKNAKTMGQETYDFTVNMFTDMKSNLGNALFDTMRGEMKSFSEYWDSFLSSIERRLADAMSDMAVNLMLFGQISKPGGGSSGGLLQGATGGLLGWVGKYLTTTSTTEPAAAIAGNFAGSMGYTGTKQGENVLGTLAGSSSEEITRAGDTFAQTITSAGSSFSGMLTGSANVLSGVVGSLGDTLSSLMSSIGSIFTGSGTGQSASVGWVGKYLTTTSTTEPAAAIAGNFAGSMGYTGTKQGENVLGTLAGSSSEEITRAGDTFAQTITSAGSSFSGMLTGSANVLSGVVGSLGDTLSSLMSSIGSIFTGSGTGQSASVGWAGTLGKAALAWYSGTGAETDVAAKAAGAINLSNTGGGEGNSGFILGNANQLYKGGSLIYSVYNNMFVGSAESMAMAGSGMAEGGSASQYVPGFDSTSMMSSADMASMAEFSDAANIGTWQTAGDAFNNVANIGTWAEGTADTATASSSTIPWVLISRIVREALGATVESSILGEKQTMSSDIANSINFVKGTMDDMGSNPEKSYGDWFKFMTSGFEFGDPAVGALPYQQSGWGPYGWFDDAMGKIGLGDWFNHDAEVRHAGGVIGYDAPLYTRPVNPALFANAPRLNLKPNERAVIGEVGETVVPRGNASSGVTQHITINAGVITTDEVANWASGVMKYARDKKVGQSYTPENPLMAGLDIKRLTGA